MAMPTAAAEEWRYSPIADLDLESHQPLGVGGTSQGSNTPARFAGDFLSGRSDVAAQIEVCDGTVTVGALSDELATAGVTVATLDADHAAADELLGSVGGDQNDYFRTLNDAFTLAPVLIDVPVGVQIDGAIVVAHRGTIGHSAQFPRLVVRVGANASANVFDLNVCGAGVLSVPVVELQVGRGGRLGYLNLQHHHRQAWQIGTHAATVAADATLVSASAAFGGGYSRVSAATELAGRGASGSLLAAYFGTQDQTLDFRTYQDHAAAHTSSNLLYVGALADTARSVYSGLIRVRPDARGTNAFQTNRNLKLSDEAWAESVPNLEIENNEVRCSHASTVGPVDPDQLYYLESRGVPPAAARRLIVAGFFSEVLAEFPIQAAAPSLRAAISAKLDEIVAAEPADAAA